MGIRDHGNSFGAARFGGAAGTIAAMWVVASLAFVVAEIASARADWWQLSLCMCGSSYSRAPWVFTVGMTLTAGFVVWGGIHTWRLTAPLVRSREWTARRRTTVLWVLLAEALLIVGMALVPYDASSAAHVFHNVMGWGQGWLLAGCMFATLFLPPPHVRIRGWSLAALAGIAFSYVMFSVGLLPYSAFEIFSIVCIATWSVLLFAQVDRRLERLGAVSRYATEPGRRNRALQY